MITGFLVQTYTDTIKRKIEKGGKNYGKLYRGQSLLVALACFIFYSKKELNKKQYIIRVICHYVITNIILVGGGKHFGWLNMDKNENILGFMALVLIIYIVIMAITVKRDQKDSQQMNKALQDYHLRQRQ